MNTSTTISGVLFCNQCKTYHPANMSCKQFATVYSGDTVKSKSDVIDNIIKQLEKLQEEIKKNEKSI